MAGAEPGGAVLEAVLTVPVAHRDPPVGFGDGQTENHYSARGTVKVYTVCADCNQTMIVIGHSTTHPDCVEPLNPVRRLELDYLEAIYDDREDDEQSLANILNAPHRAPDRGGCAAIFASWGWPVFPLVPTQKIPLTAHGVLDATVDVDQIRQWWKATPGANIGIRTGVAFDVIDIDAHHGGWVSYVELASRSALPDIHGTVRTPRGGKHLYVKPTGEGNRAALLPGVDYRGLNGYVVGAGSSDARGFTYDFEFIPSAEIRPGQHGGA